MSVTRPSRLAFLVGQGTKDDQSTWEGLFHLTLPHHSPSLREVRAGAQGRALESVTEVETAEGCCLLVCIVCSFTPARVLLHHALIQKRPHRPACRLSLWRHVSLLWFPLLCWCLGLCQLDKSQHKGLLSKTCKEPKTQLQGGKVPIMYTNVQHH